ncbi:MAG: hypothetical protein JO142_16960 [Burkholderiales bacterium]|nr:hypothetical protein [Burkholderiales bacterium]
MSIALCLNDTQLKYFTVPESRLDRALPGPLPEHFPAPFKARFESLAQSDDVSDAALQHLYFDLVLCPRLLQEEVANGAAGAMDWSVYIDGRLGRRWRECLACHGDATWMCEELALLSSFRLMAEHLH